MQRLMEEVFQDDEIQETIFDDEEEEGEVDNLEERPDGSDTEQEFSDEDVSENLTVGPHFLGKDKITKWQKHIPPRNVRTRSENLLSHLPGAKHITKSLKSLLEIWQYFFNDAMMNLIVEATNKRIRKLQANYSRE